MPKKTSLVLLLLFPFITSAQQMWINEIHYDNTGGDVDEFVEVVIENTFVGNLSDLEIIFYNGNGGGVITQSEPRTLDTFDLGVNSGGFTLYSRLFTSGIQNGPDGIALVNNGIVVEFISYEGVVTADGGPADGMTSVDIGVFEPGAIGQSLQLSGIGNLQSLFTWQAPASATRGTLNNGQVFADVAPKVVNIFPSNGTSGVGYQTPINIEFSEPVNIVNPASVDIICGGIMQNFNVTQDGDSSHYIVIPVNFWNISQTCNATIVASNVTAVDNGDQLDGDGNGVGGDDFLFSFTVASDPIPTVTSVNPTDGTVLVPQSFSVEINFNENVNLTNNAINLNCPSAVPYTATSLSNVDTVTITPNAPVAEGSFCAVTLNAVNILDTDGPDFSQLDGNNDGVAGGNYSFGFAIIEAIFEIHDIQGNDNASPLDGSFVRTEGDIVTALTESGFYMQAPDADNDADSETSEGIFVFTDNAFTVAVGDLVNIRGRVVEFFELTEIESVSSVSITAPNQTLPTVIEFNATNPSQLSPANRSDFDNRFEKYEGMLVSVANGVANSGTDNRGEFFATATGQRAYREPGVEFSQTGDNQLPYDLIDPQATPTSYDPDIFDENPELFNVDTNGLKDKMIIDINGGSTFSATGVLSYGFGNYNLLPKVISTVNKPIVAIDMPAATEITVATQNMFRFYDDVDDIAIEDFQEDSTTTMRFVERTEKASLYFRTTMLAPDIIVLTEIENLVAVQAIADQITVDDGTLAYTAHLIEGQDFGGIDIGFLTKSTVSNITVSQLGKDETIAFNLPMPPELPRPLHDRPPLLLNAIVTKGGASREINVLGVHNRSRSGITGSQRQRIRNKHLEQAISIGNMVQNLQSPTAALVVIGDFNDFEFSDGYADVIGEIKGVVEPNKNLLSSNGNSLVNPTLVNAVDTLADEEKYSFIFRGTIQALDHALINDVALAYLSKTTFVRGNVDAPEMFEDIYTQTLNMSDHDGLMIYLDLDTVLETIFLDGFED
jgi:predicted extracellular nuclease